MGLIDEGAIIMDAIEQITSSEAEHLLPKDIINLLWYIWETEYKNKNVRFFLSKSYEVGKQDITIFTEREKSKSLTVSLDNPVNADVSIAVPSNRFVMYN